MSYVCTITKPASKWRREFKILLKVQLHVRNRLYLYFYWCRNWNLLQGRTVNQHLFTSLSCKIKKSAEDCSFKEKRNGHIINRLLPCQWFWKIRLIWAKRNIHEFLLKFTDMQMQIAWWAAHFWPLGLCCALLCCQEQWQSADRQFNAEP